MPGPNKSVQRKIDEFNAASKQLQDVLARWWRSLGYPEFVPLLKAGGSSRAESVGDDLEQFLDAILDMGRASEEFEKGFLDLEEGKVAEDWLDGLGQFTQRLEEIIDGAQQWAKDLSPRIQAVAEELAKQGWYIDPQLSLDFRLLESLVQSIGERPKLVESELADFIRGRLDVIESGTGGVLPRPRTDSTRRVPGAS